LLVEGCGDEETGCDQEADPVDSLAVNKKKDTEEQQ
jgi:hypothetical protein